MSVNNIVKDGLIIPFKKGQKIKIDQKFTKNSLPRRMSRNMELIIIKEINKLINLNIISVNKYN